MALAASSGLTVLLPSSLGVVGGYCSELVAMQCANSSSACGLLQCDGGVVDHLYVHYISRYHHSTGRGDPRSVTVNRGRENWAEHLLNSIQAASPRVCIQ